MNFNRRVKDLTEVFDEKYKANKNNHDRIIQERKDFNYKMFGIRDKEDLRKEIRESNSISSKVNNLNQKINAAKGANNIEKMNNIRNNFR